MTTPNLAITHVAASQNQKEVTINAAFDALDNAGNREVVITYADADVTLTADQARRNAVIRCTGSVTVNRRLTLPAGRRLLCVDNRVSGGRSIEVGYPTGERVWVPPLASVWVQGDTTNVQAIGTGAEIGFFVAGEPDADELVGVFVASRRFVIVAGAPGARGYAEVAPTAGASFSIQRNAVSIGSASFAAASNTATFTVATDALFEPGDRLMLRAPVAQDATLADIAITLRARML
jgi:hypothetical protein